MLNSGIEIHTLRKICKNPIKIIQYVYPMYCLYMKEFFVLIFHMCFTRILNYALHCRVEGNVRKLKGKDTFLPWHYPFSTDLSSEKKKSI